MIETSNPEIDVNELLERVRQKAATIISRESREVHTQIKTGRTARLPNVSRDILAHPALVLSRPVEMNKERTDDMLRKTRGMIEVSSRIPKMFRRFFRRQGGYNRAALDTIISLAKRNEQLNKRVRELATAVEQQNQWMRVLAGQRQSEATWMKAASPILSSFAAAEEEVSHLAEKVTQSSEQLANLQSQAERAAEQFRNLQDETERQGKCMQGWHDQSDHHGEHLRNLQGQADRSAEHLGNLQVQTDRQGEAIRGWHSQSERHGEHLRNLQGQADRSLEQLGNLQSQADRSAEHLGNLQVQTDRHGESMQGWQGQSERHGEHLRNLQGQADRSLEQLGNLQSQADRSAEHLGNLQVQTDRHGESMQGWQGQSERHGEHLRNLQGQTDRQGEYAVTWREQAQREAEQLAALQRQADRAGEHLRNLQGDADRHGGKTDTHLGNMTHLQHMLVRIEERQANDAIYIKGELSQHSAEIQQWLRAPKAKRGAGAAAPESRTEERDLHRLDSFYLSFENRFRGERAEIKKRVSVYLPLLLKASAGVAERPVLDLGCGRGEWLELLQENALRAAGVDLNTAMVAQCEQRNLAVTLGDAVEHLRSLPDQSQGAVTGFHIIEHLPLETLIDLCSEARRVLKPGGLAIFESPNCKNLMVGACNFNVDPTHRNPVFPETAEFILATQGFEKIRIEYLSPVDTSHLPESSSESPTLQQLLYGPQDFAVIGRRPDAG